MDSTFLEIYTLLILVTGSRCRWLYCPTLFHAGLPKGTWWSNPKRCVVNDISLSISDNDTPNSKREYLHGTILQMPHELRQGRQHRNGKRTKALHALLREHTKQVSLPFHVVGTLRVPNLSTVPKMVLTTILRKMPHKRDV